MAGTLFITRKFPPSVGGMETLAADVWAALAAGSHGARLISHGGANRWLPLWLPVAASRAALLIWRRKVDVVLTGDILLYLLMAPLLRVLRVRHATMAMGKDIVWANHGYQRAVRAGLRRAPMVLAISAATAEAAITSGAPPGRVRVVRLGAHDPQVKTQQRRDARAELQSRHAIDDDEVILLTLGRLVRRKGVEWFIREVVPKAPRRAMYIVAGAGEEYPRIEAAVAALADPTRVRVLGPVSAQDRELLMCGADIFIQANIQVPGDMEGFGLVAVEAAMRGALVLASDLEGLRDAVIDGVTGILLAPGNADVWVAQLKALVGDAPSRRELAERFAIATRERCSTQAMGRELHSILGLDVERGVGEPS